jgi:hypothetical protein
MTRTIRILSWVLSAAALHLAAWGTVAPPAEGGEHKPAPAGEVTLKGVMMLEDACTPKAAKEVRHMVVLFALEGTPEVATTLDAIMKENWPGDSMDAKQARNMNDAFSTRLKYYFTPGEFATKCVNGSKDAPGCMWGEPWVGVTGMISEKGGKKWITPSKVFTQYPDRKQVTPRYPDKMLAPDKPLKMPGKNPLILRVSDKLSLRCILLPRGSFLFLKPYYVQPRWQDEFPIVVTFTKPFWLAEIPVTQEMWESVMPNNPSTLKDPQRPVRNVTCAEVNKFCRILSANNGRTVRLPGEAEWEYAARVGTSNPQLDVKYQGQNSAGPGRGVCLPVKSKQPNAWGLYDMLNPGAFEMLRDAFVLDRRVDEVDPYFSCEKDEAAGKKHAHWGRNTVTYHEGVGDAKDDAAYGSTKFRVVVEATPEEIAEMEKTAGK